MSIGSLTSSLRETLEIFEESGTPMTTNEVAEILDLGRRSTYDRLDRLVDQGYIDTKKVGASARVWWRPIADHVATGSDADVEVVDGDFDRLPGDWNGEGIPVGEVLDQAEVGVFVLDSDFRVAWVNDAICRYFGFEREAVVGRDKRELIRDRIQTALADADEFAETVLATYDDNTDTEEFECHVTPEAGREERWLEHRSKPIESGPYAGGRVEVYYDITDRRRTAMQLEEEHDRFQSLVRAVDEYAIFMLDPEGRVQTWNEGAKRLNGYEREEILGEHFSTFYTAAAREAGEPAANLADTRDRGMVECEGWRVTKDGSTFWANVTMSAIYDDDGALKGYAKVTRDMTDHRERERAIRAERNLLEQILETSPIAIGVFHPDGSVDRVNSRTAELLGLAGDDVEQYTLGELGLLGDDGELLPFEEMPAGQVIRTGTPVVDQEFKIEYPDRGTRWFSANAAPLSDDDGELERVVVTLVDITQRKEQARRLQRQRDELKAELDDVFERVSDGFLGLDDEWRITYLNDHGEDLLGKDEEELLGMNVWDAFPDALARSYRDRYERAMRAQEATVFEEYSDEADAWLEVAAYPSESGLSIYFRDISERKERERELEESEQRYRTIVENFPDGAVALVDENLQYTLIGGEVLDQLGVQASDIVGSRVGESPVVESTEVRELLEEPLRDALRGEQTTFETTWRDRTFAFRILPVTDESGDVFAGMMIAQDITERTAHERQLEESERRYRTLIENFPNGVVGLLDEDLRYLVLGGEEFDGLDVSVTDLEGRTIYEQLPEEIAATLEHEYRATFEGESREFEMTYGDRVRKFHTVPMYDDEGNVYAIMGMSQDITRLRENERELEHQREQLTALNNLHTIVRDITDAVIEQSTREEIEETVCERLAASDSYSFAWFSEVDPRSQSIEPKVEAGVEGYLDAISLSVNPDDPTGRGPTGRAAQTQEIQVVQDVFQNPDFEPWHENAEAYGFRSSAAIPVTHEGTTYGVLGIYTDRRFAFTDQEKEVISQLGEIVGHAIAAVERKRALLSDEVVELEFKIRDVFDAVGGPAEVDGSVVFETMIPIGDGDFLEYGTATGNTMAVIEHLVASEALPHWESVSVLETDDDRTRFELKLVDPPILTSVTDHGGYVDEARFDGSDYYMRIHLTTNTDVRQVVDDIKDAYPSIEMITHRQVTRDRPTAGRLRGVLFEELTDRQRAAIEMAFHAGYFEWPRDTSGEELATSMDVSPSTFHQHLRKAQRKLLAAAIEDLEGE